MRTMERKKGEEEVGLQRQEGMDEARSDDSGFAINDFVGDRGEVREGDSANDVGDISR